MRDDRSIDEKISDMLADNWLLEDIAYQLRMALGAVRQRYVVICGRMGEKPDEE